ncbi:MULTISPECIES: Mini-ribonuclease 3 [unclassified Cetobacterium]|uniref:Mini-ribonuclease 3 n=1 Tax=unclassified Cetobacterium TaxID=2630983 RepID=UPI00163B79E0|nr:ribonuclease III domain-containing protein [Cetobacterium sp. 8H]MBC2850755.1 Mini-ribonuclease 3-like protein [Cetobacterium sp. 8H]
MVNLDVREANGLVLAYLGDAVWELSIRTYFINKGYNIRNLNKLVKEHVNAQAQSKYLKNIIETLDEEKLTLVNRSKNSNIKTFPKSCSVMEYKEATAFEALIGALYTEGKIEEIRKIIERNLG